MAKRFNSVMEMLDDAGVSKRFRDSLEETIESRPLAKHLSIMRNVAGLTQEEMAAHLGCRQARISKIENSPDEALRLRDVMAYTEAVGCELEINIVDPDETVADQVKRHVFAIRDLLDYLAELAKKDDDINEGVLDFFWESLFTQFRFFQETYAKVPNAARKTQEILRVLSSEHFEGIEQRELERRDAQRLAATSGTDA